MLTAKGTYGLKALIHLASLRLGEQVLSAEIAKANNISKKFLDSILRELRQSGLVTAKKGPGGGYSLAKPATSIKIGNAIRRLDGPLAPIACASRTAYKPCRDCHVPKACAVRMTMTRVRDSVSSVLDEMTIYELVARQRSPRPRRRQRPRRSQRTKPA